MLAYEFILVFALLLGCAAILMQPVWEHENAWNSQQEEWEDEKQSDECQTAHTLAETRTIVWKNTCEGIETLAGWDANHYA
jgi:hypothetical protein